MYTAVDGARVPIRMWADPASVEDQAMRQLQNVANLPWVHGVAVMPDVHYGKGATVGSVIAMRDAVSPAAVGVDIDPGSDLDSRDQVLVGDDVGYLTRLMGVGGEEDEVAVDQCTRGVRLVDVLADANELDLRVRPPGNTTPEGNLGG